MVPENKRYCANCGEKLKREKGFCPKCGKPYAFAPALQPGDVIAEQYEVIGCMAFGGLGWIYLGKDKVLSRWVVLKGLLNAKDEVAAAAAVAERQFLAAVKHSNIVGVYNFVQRGTEGYIVMEYVAGKSLKSIRKERGPLPVTEAIAYIHRILGAFSYLHRQNPPLVYCDFKPDNFMLEGDDVKLIDMGGVRRVDDPGGDIYGTAGYSAPEAGDGPTIVSDLFTVARTLAVLICDFKGYQSTYEFILPPPEEHAVFAKHESLYRFLNRATRQNPDERFQSADEMAEQLAGVLREIVSHEQNIPHPAESAHFGGDVLRLQSVIDEGAYRPRPQLVPALKVDPTDPAAQFLLSSAMSAAKIEQQMQFYSQGVAKFPNSVEIKLRLALCLIEAGRPLDATPLLDSVLESDPWDWRVIWIRGLAHFHASEWREAAAHFDHVYSELPGELGPKLAVALAAEAAGDLEYAAKLYDTVSTTDRDFTTASFGLARCLAALERRDDAIAAYGRVPESSSAYKYAQVALARTWLLATPRIAPNPSDFERAAATLDAVTLDLVEKHRLTVEVQSRALDLLQSRKIPPVAKIQLFGQPLHEAGLRLGIESALRAIARLLDTDEERIQFVDMANEIRPKTLL